MRLERSDLFVRVVVEHTELEVVAPSDEPVLPRDELDASCWNFRYFKGLDDGACFMVVDVDGAVVETGEEPWLGRVEVDAFDAVRPLEKFPLISLISSFVIITSDNTYVDLEKHGEK
jgi:hypothetical protein